MQDNQEQIEGLHQQAAAYYLQGDFAKALAHWQQLLAYDSTDERAVEGVRLCEMLSEDGGESAAPPAEAPSSVPTAAAAPEDSAMEWDLSKLDLEATRVEGMQTVPRPPEVSDGGILAGLPDLGTLEPDGEAFEGDDLTGLDAALDDASMDDRAVSPGAQELSSRVNELILEATRSYDAGDYESALSAVERIFILDENNAPAQNLKAAIESESAGAAEPDPSTFDAMDALDGSEGESLDIAPPHPAPEPVEDADAPLEPLSDLSQDLDIQHEPDPADIPMAGIDSIPDGVRSAQREAAQAEAPAQAPRVSRLPSPKFLALYGVGLLVILGVGWGALQYIGRSPDPELDQSVREMQAISKKQPKQQKKQKGSDAAGDGATGTVTVDGLPDLIGRAQAAVAAGEYSQAIVAFNQVLEIDPTHAIAKAGLASAAERYRVEREYLEKMNEARSAWDRQDYRKAMRIFYRLPEADGNARFDRYKVNGWYNLGVQALQTGDCDDAKAHFSELKLMTEGDASASLFELTKSCKYPAADPDYDAKLDELALRGLDD